MKRTFNELFKYFQRGLTQPYKDNVKQIRFVELYEATRLEWLKLKIKDVEQTELLNRDLDVFYRSTNVGTTAQANKSLIEGVGERIRFVMAVHGDFTLSCNGIANTYTLPIQPKGKDSLFGMMSDPFRQPDDADPV